TTQSTKSVTTPTESTVTSVSPESTTTGTTQSTKSVTTPTESTVTSVSPESTTTGTTQSTESVTTPTESTVTSVSPESTTTGTTQSTESVTTPTESTVTSVSPESTITGTTQSTESVTTPTESTVTSVSPESTTTGTTQSTESVTTPTESTVTSVSPESTTTGTTQPTESVTTPTQSTVTSVSPESTTTGTTQSTESVTTPTESTVTSVSPESTTTGTTQSTESVTTPTESTVTSVSPESTTTGTTQSTESVTTQTQSTVTSVSPESTTTGTTQSTESVTTPTESTVTSVSPESTTTGTTQSTESVTTPTESTVTSISPESTTTGTTQSTESVTTPTESTVTSVSPESTTSDGSMLTTVSECVGPAQCLACFNESDVDFCTKNGWWENCDHEDPVCMTEIIRKRRGLLISVSRFCASRNYCDATIENHGEKTCSKIVSPQHPNEQKVELCRECTPTPDHCGVIPKPCLPTETFTCDACDVKLKPGDKTSLDDRCDQESKKIECSADMPYCKLTRYQRERGDVIWVVRECGSNATCETVDYNNDDNQPTSELHTRKCEVINGVQGNPNVARKCSMCMVSSNPCKTPTVTIDPCAGSIKQCYKCNAKNEADCINSGVTEDCNANSQACLTQEITNKRGEVEKFISGCQNKTEYESECDVMDNEKCSNIYSDLAIPTGVDTTKDVVCSICTTPTICNPVTTPLITTSSTCTVDLQPSCKRCDRSQTCAEDDAIEYCQGNEKFCLEEQFFDHFGTYDGSNARCVTTCDTSKSCDSQTSTGSCNVCSQPTYVCPSAPPTPCPLGQQPSCLECQGDNEKKCDAVGKPRICEGDNPVCKEEWVRNFRGTTTSFTRTCSKLEECAAGGMVECTSDNLSNDHCHQCTSLSICSTENVTCETGYQPVCYVCDKAPSEEFCSRGVKVPCVHGVCKKVISRDGKGNEVVSMSCAEEYETTCPSPVNWDNCELTGSGNDVKKTCCGYSEECTPADGSQVTEAPLTSTIIPTYTTNEPTCKDPEIKMCWTCIRARSEEHCKQKNVGSWLECTGESYCETEWAYDPNDRSRPTEVTQQCATADYCDQFSNTNHMSFAFGKKRRVHRICGEPVCRRPDPPNAIFCWIFFDIPWKTDYGNEFSDAWWDIIMPIDLLLFRISSSFFGFASKNILSLHKGSVIANVEFGMIPTVDSALIDAFGVHVLREVMAANNTIEINGENVTFNVEYFFPNDVTLDDRDQVLRNVTALHFLDVCELPEYGICENGGICKSDANEQIISCECPNGTTGAYCQTVVNDNSNTLILIIIVGVLGPLAIVALVIALNYCSKYLKKEKKQKNERIAAETINRFHVRDTGNWGTMTSHFTPSYRHQHWRNFLGGTPYFGDHSQQQPNEFDPDDASVATIHRDRFFSNRNWNVTEYDRGDDDYMYKANRDDDQDIAPVHASRRYDGQFDDDEDSDDDSSDFQIPRPQMSSSGAFRMPQFQGLRMTDRPATFTFPNSNSHEWDWDSNL
ncbi:hypothetical protein CAPTEDRAFT_214474, partial [Capitella teleta]